MAENGGDSIIHFVLFASAMKCFWWTLKPNATFLLQSQKFISKMHYNGNIILKAMTNTSKKLLEYFQASQKKPPKQLVQLGTYVLVRKVATCSGTDSVYFSFYNILRGQRWWWWWWWGWWWRWWWLGSMREKDRERRKCLMGQSLSTQPIHCMPNRLHYNTFHYITIHSNNTAQNTGHYNKHSTALNLTVMYNIFDFWDAHISLISHFLLFHFFPFPSQPPSHPSLHPLLTPCMSYNV